MHHATAMTANIGLPSHPLFLRRVLLVDAVTCLATGLAMTVGADLISGLTELPGQLLGAAGASLYPIALFMALVGTRTPIPAAGVWLIVVGNVGWVIGSLALLGGAVTFNAFGAAFIATQALVVAALAALEFAGLRRL